MARLSRIQKLVIVALCVVPLLLIIALPHVNSSLLISANLNAMIPPTGRRLLVHDNNIAYPSCYAVLYADTTQWPGEGNLMIAAYRYDTDTLLFTQLAVPYNEWLSSPGWYNYVVSNIMTAQFYLAYQLSATSIAVKTVTFGYNSTNAPVSSFAIGPPVVVASGLPPMAGNVLDALYAYDGSLWVATIYVASGIQNIRLVQTKNATITNSQTIPLPVVSGLQWNVQLTETSNKVLVWASSHYLSAVAAYGRLYDTSGTLLYTTTHYTYLYSSVVSLENGNALMLYPVNDGVNFDTVTYTPAGVASESVTNIGLKAMNDLSAFGMPNSYYGFFYTSSAGLYVMYYTSQWSSALQVAGVGSGISSVGPPVSADRSSVVQSMLARPAAWTFTYPNAGYGYINLYLMDLPSLMNVSHVIVYTTITATAVSISMHTITVYANTTTLVSMGSTITESKLLTPAFQLNLLILLLLVLLPAGAIGAWTGILGFIIGAIAGATLGLITKNLPFWIYLEILFMLLMALVLFREKGLLRRQEEGSGE